MTVKTANRAPHRIGPQTARTRAKALNKAERIAVAQERGAQRKSEFETILKDMQAQMAPQCPECGRSDFKSERGMQQHRSKAHADLPVK